MSRNQLSAPDGEDRETYVLAAFNVESEKSIMYRKYRTLLGLQRGVGRAMEDGADYVSLRRIRAKEVK